MSLCSGCVSVRVDSRKRMEKHFRGQKAWRSTPPVGERLEGVTRIVISRAIHYVVVVVREAKAEVEAQQGLEELICEVRASHAGQKEAEAIQYFEEAAAVEVTVPEGEKEATHSGEAVSDEACKPPHEEGEKNIEDFEENFDAPEPGVIELSIQQQLEAFSWQSNIGRQPAKLTRARRPGCSKKCPKEKKEVLLTGLDSLDEEATQRLYWGRAFSVATMMVVCMVMAISLPEPEAEEIRAIAANAEESWTAPAKHELVESFLREWDTDSDGTCWMRSLLSCGRPTQVSQRRLSRRRSRTPTLTKT